MSEYQKYKKAYKSVPYRYKSKVAKILGVTQMTLQNYYNGKTSKPTDEFFRKAINACIKVREQHIQDETKDLERIKRITVIDPKKVD